MRPARMVGRRGALTEERVRQIRAEYAQAKCVPTMVKRAASHGVSLTAFRDIGRGVSYKWVKGDEHETT